MCVHAESLESAPEQQPRAIMAQSYMYDATPFQRPRNPPTTSIGMAVEKARLAGIELWQVHGLFSAVLLEYLQNTWEMRHCHMLHLKVGTSCNQDISV